MEALTQVGISVAILLSLNCITHIILWFAWWIQGATNLFINSFKFAVFIQSIFPFFKYSRVDASAWSTRWWLIHFINCFFIWLTQLIKVLTLSDTTFLRIWWTKSRTTSFWSSLWRLTSSRNHDPRVIRRFRPRNSRRRNNRRWCINNILSIAIHINSATHNNKFSTCKLAELPNQESNFSILVKFLC